MTLSRILSSEPLPIPPSGLTPSMEKYLRDLHAYLQRLAGRFTAENISNEINFVSSSFLRIQGYHPAFFGDTIYYDNGGTPTPCSEKAGAVEDDHHSDLTIEWDGSFRWMVWTAPNTIAFHPIAGDLGTAGPGNDYKTIKIRSQPGKYTNVQNGLTRLFTSGNDMEFRLYPYINDTIFYGYSIAYRRVAAGPGQKIKPHWGTYTYYDNASGGTSAQFEGVGNTFPATITILPPY